MKILITTDLFTTDTNGVVTSLRNLCEELEKKGHDVRILTLSEDAHSRQEINVYYIRSMPLKVYPDVRMPMTYRHVLIKELVEWKPDVIHSQCEFFSYWFALRISKLTGAPIVHTYHTLYEQYVSYIFLGQKVGGRVVSTLSRKRLKRADRVIAPTHKVKAALENYGLHNDIRVVPSGISMEKYKERLTPEERLERRRALGIADDEFVLINLGRLGNEKNLEEIVEFYNKALKKGMDKLRLLIVGDGPARESLREKAEELCISDKVVFTGMVPQKEVQNYYQLGDTFVSASTSETQGLTYIEASANGLPLLCRHDLCLTGVLMNGENGYEYTCEEEFIAGLEKILADGEWRREASRRSEEIAAGFDKSVFGDSIEKIYIEVINENLASENQKK